MNVKITLLQKVARSAFMDLSKDGIIMYDVQSIEDAKRLIVTLLRFEELKRR